MKTSIKYIETCLKLPVKQCNTSFKGSSLIQVNLLKCTSGITKYYPLKASANFLEVSTSKDLTVFSYKEWFMNIKTLKWWQSSFSVCFFRFQLRQIMFQGSCLLVVVSRCWYWISKNWEKICALHNGFILPLPTFL